MRHAYDLEITLAVSHLFLSLIHIFVYIVDFAFSAAAAFHLHERIPAWEQALDQMRAELRCV